MNTFVWTVRVRTEAPRTVVVHARNHAFSIGEPLSFRPTDEHPSALEMMLGAFAADLTATFRSLAFKQRLPLDALEFSASCTLHNPLIYVGVQGEQGHPGLQRIEGTLYVSSDAEEAFALMEVGADFIQFDEPVLTELVFTQGQTRTFMCAALAARKDPAEELEFAVGLINRVVEGLEGVRTGLHVCRGNWSRNEATLLRGNYAPLKPWFAQLKVRQLVLEYATPRAGDLLAFEEKEVGLGVVNPRTNEIETVEEIVSRVQNALQLVSREKLFLNPDCGFGTFSARPMNDIEHVEAKLRFLTQAAHRLREEV